MIRTTPYLLSSSAALLRSNLGQGRCR